MKVARKPPRLFVQRAQRRRRHTAWWRYLAFSLCFFGLILSGYWYYFAREIHTRFASRRWSVPARVFSSSTFIYPGQAHSPADIERMLKMRNFQRAAGQQLHAGEYWLNTNTLTARLRGFRFPGKTLEAQEVRLLFDRDLLTAVEGADGPVPFVELEPLEIAQLFGSERESRILISIHQVPRHLVHAVTAVEDHRFYEHPGLDWRGISRAIWADLRAGGVVQGGSTITQQLVKNYFLKPERTFTRKAVEACMAVVLEASYSKDEIMEMYLNEIYLGQRASTAIHGMGEAARYYFGRNVEDLTLAESATLAGMIRAPNAYSPLRQPEACLERRNGVLKRMADLRWIGPAEYEAARTAPLQLPARTPPLKCAPYFVDYLRQQLHELYDPEMLASEGLTVYTTLNPEVSAAAETALSEGVAALERNHPQLLRGGDDNPLQAAMVVLHPKTGAILALVGGRDYDTSSFNRALFARRQPGSAIKPFVYLAALEEFTTASWLPDDPVSYLVSGKSWSPRNFDGRYRGQVTLRRALEESLNAATVQLALTVGLERVIGTLRAMGITAPMAPVPSLALGSLEVTPIELAKAYATLANEGQEPYLLTLREVATAAGDVLERRQVGFETVTSAAKAYIVNSMLQGVMQRGTGKVARSWGIDFPCAGKTGTTNNQQDSWFAGFTTDLLALVWVGYDDNRPTPFTGASGALRIWSHFFRRVRPLIHPQPFRVPPGIVERYVCPESGFLANPACPDKEKEAFLSDKVPRQSCGLHTP